MKNSILTLITAFALLFSACSTEKKLAFNEKAALEFLYQYMPLGDSVDYAEDYYRECVHYAFLAKQEMPWGDSIPEREFKLRGACARQQRESRPLPCHLL